MENYSSSRIVVLAKFFAFVRWKGKIYRQPFFVTTANTSPNLLSRDACYTLGVVKPCYAVEAEQSNLHTDLQTNLQNVTDLQGNWPQIYSTEASNTQLSDEELKQRSSDEKHRQRSSWCSETQLQTQWSIHPKQRLPDEKQRSRHSTQNTGQSTEIVNSRKASSDLNTGSEYRSTGKSTGYFRSTTKSTRSSGSTTWSATRSTPTARKQPPVANPVDSTSHANFRSSFQTEEEGKQMRPSQLHIQGRGVHNYRQKMRDPDLQMDLQSNLQEIFIQIHRRIFIWIYK